MIDKSSGTYVIDSEYNIITYNATAMELYPQLAKGEKCYKCLMDREAPCEVCPVLNHVQGPKTYFDPIRKIYETVDSVELLLEDGTTGHALVFSTVGEREQISKRLPQNEEELNSLFDKLYWDTLTEGYNREGFIREAEKILKESGKTEEYAVLFFDPQKFKAVNARFGTEIGDMFLKWLFLHIKNSELQPLLSARIEADHIACLIPRSALSLEELEKLLFVEWEFNNQMVRIHLRCGIYLVDSFDETPVSIMLDRSRIAKQFSNADHSLAYAVFDNAMQNDYLSEAEIVSDFQESLREKQFEVYYQPVVSVENGDVVSAEALVRWNHPVFGFLSPEKFIPILEKNGFITQLDRYVFETVNEFAKRRRQEAKEELPISVNLSWQDFYDDSMMNEMLVCLSSDNCPQGSILCELTETSIALMEQNCIYLLEQFRKCGARILLDDFGSGYSSFGMIRNYEFDLLKIDRGFICQIPENPKVQDIVATIIEMSHKIGMKVVAEGVELQREVDILRKYGCDYIQGYFYSRPLPEGEFTEFLNTQKENTKKKDDLASAQAHGGDTVRLPHSSAQQQETQVVNEKLLAEILDHSGQFIQICHPEDYTMVYANQVTRMISVDPEKSYFGEKCYQYMLGLDTPCGHCPMQQMGDAQEKEIEVDDGEHCFALKARYMDWQGRRIFMEYGRDITEIKRAQKRYDSQISSILKSIPEEQGVFHVDVTADLWFSSGGNAQNARMLQDIRDVDTLIRRISSFVPDQEGKERFFKTFCRAAMLQAYDQGHREIRLDTLSYYDDGSIRWSRITAKLIFNPESRHLESVIYGIDISKEKEREKAVQRVEEQLTKAEHEKRIDFLTGLHNRLDLFDMLKDALSGKLPEIRAMYMIDIDNFKELNDTYGHLVGDECLRQIGAVLKKYEQEHDMVFCRYGGEEFLGLGFDTEASAAVIAAEILTLINTLSITMDNQGIAQITASIGYTLQNTRYEKMIDLADKAMYRAKRLGKNRVVCYDK
ncbi:MAG: EAL domain-containing protein [Eubacteriales bacterium]|nr:EAL domain-containing protein [Eubacteriales bacterium]